MKFERSSFDTSESEYLNKRETVAIQSLDKMKKVTRRLVAWGMISGAVMTGIKTPETNAQEGEQGEPQIEELYEERINYLRGVYGEEVIGVKIEGAFQVGELAEGVVSVIDKIMPDRLQEKEDKTEFVGFERLNIDQETLQSIFVESYPDNWIHPDIDEVEFKPSEKVAMPTVYGMQGAQGGSATVSPGIIKSDVKLYPTDIFQINDIYSHETAHVNDWESDSTLSKEERLKLFFDVTELYLSGDVYKSSYVEDIKNEDRDLELYTKVSEWWAEITMAYFRNPSLFQIYNQREFTIVDGWVKKQDPDFDPVQAWRDRVDTMYAYSDIQDGKTPRISAHERIEKELRLSESSSADGDVSNTETDGIPETALAEINENRVSLLSIYQADQKYGGNWAGEEVLRILDRHGVDPISANNYLVEFYAEMIKNTPK